MSVNKIVTKVDGTINKTIDFNDLKAGLAAGSHTITVEAWNGAALISTQTKNITIAAVATFEAETTSLMNAIATPNDGTATIYTGVTGSQLWTLVNNLISGLKTNNLLAKLFYYHLFLGGTALTQKYNLKDTTAFPLTWYGGWVHDNKGALGNGANTYADTGFVASANKDVNSNGLSIVIGTDNVPQQTNVIEMGAHNSGTQSSTIIIRDNNSERLFKARMNGSNVDALNYDARGVYTAVRIDSTTSLTIKNSVEKSSWNSGGTLPTINTFIGNISFQTNDPYVPGYSNQRFQGALEHAGLTLTETQTLHSLIDTFEAGLGRKTW